MSRPIVCDGGKLDGCVHSLANDFQEIAVELDMVKGAITKVLAARSKWEGDRSARRWHGKPLHQRSYKERIQDPTLVAVATAVRALLELQKAFLSQVAEVVVTPDSITAEANLLAYGEHSPEESSYRCSRCCVEYIGQRRVSRHPLCARCDVPQQAQRVEEAIQRAKLVEAEVQACREAEVLRVLEAQGSLPEEKKD